MSYEYLKGHSDVPSQLLAAFSGLNKFENCLGPQSISGTPLSSTAKSEIRDVAAALTQYLEAEVKNNKHLGMKNEKFNFLLGALQIRLIEIANHLGVTAIDSPLSPEMRDLAQSIKNHSNVINIK